MHPPKAFSDAGFVALYALHEYLFEKDVYVQVVYASTWCSLIMECRPQGSDCIPAGYEPVTLVEPLNGPLAASRDAAGSPQMARPASGPQRSRYDALLAVTITL